MFTTSRASAAVLAAALVLGGATAPAMAATRTADWSPSPITRFQQQAPQVLDAAVVAARADYALAIATAKAERRAALEVPRAERDAALAAARTKAERRLVRSAYRRAIAPVGAQYVLARRAATATRDAALESALATYLVATGTPEVAEALSIYRDSTVKARDTLALALRSAAETFRTDTADERAQLQETLDEATTASARSAAWKGFIAATQAERSAHTAAITGARTTYYSAMRQARAVFKAETGVGVRTLMKRTFGG